MTKKLGDTHDNDPDRLTEKILHAETIPSEYGLVSGREWCEKEVERLSRKGIKASVVDTSSSWGPQCYVRKAGLKFSPYSSYNKYLSKEDGIDEIKRT